MIVVDRVLLASRMLEYFRKVEEGGEELIVTRDGVPIIRVIPLKQRRSVAEVFADVRGKVKYRADLLEPEFPS